MAAFVNFNPGVYYGGSRVSLGSVDMNTAVGSLFPVPFLKNVYGLFGLEISVLAHYPVQPFGGRGLAHHRPHAPPGGARRSRASFTR